MNRSDYIVRLLSSGRRRPGQMNHIDLLHICGKSERWMRNGKKESQWKECDALGNVLLGNSGHGICMSFTLKHTPDSGDVPHCKHSSRTL